MRICPDCRTVYSGRDADVCVRDGAALVDARAFAETEADPLLGMTIAGRYHIVDRVGIGGMGTVYRAEQYGLHRHVALKILKRELVWDRDTVTRFHREAKAMSLLTHPNTVRVFDFGETDDGLLYLAMELLEGELLTTRLDRDGALPSHEAVWLAQQILRSLAEAHSKGIIHRDLKPDNIYLARIEGHAAPVVKVLDFGIAKVIEGDRKIDQLETQAGTVFGTPRYMSPEQAQGKPLDARSDLYSVGVLLYQILTGRPPFTDEDAVVVMAKHIRERPARPSLAAPPDRFIVPSLERALLKSIEKDQAKRFQSAEEFEANLAGCMKDVQAAERLETRGKRRRVLLAFSLAAAVVLTVGGISAGAYSLLRSTGKNRPRHAPVLIGEIQTAPADIDGPSGAPVPHSVLVTSEPTGAEVWRDGERLGVTPLPIEIEEGARAQLELRKVGSDAVQAEITGDEETRLVYLPDPAPTAHGPNRAKRHHGPVRVQQPPSAATSSPTSTAGQQQTSDTRPDPYERFE